MFCGIAVYNVYYWRVVVGVLGSAGICSFASIDPVTTLSAVL